MVPIVSDLQRPHSGTVNAVGPSTPTLLRRAALIVEGNDALRRSCQVGDEEPNARIKLAGVPLDLGHDTPRLFPALRLIAEAGVVAAHLVRRSPDRALQQVSDPVLQDPVGRQSDRVPDAVAFKE